MHNRSEFIAHVTSSYPHEACGVVVADTYIPCDNVAEDPEHEFELAPSVQAKYGDSIQLIVHSHIIDPSSPFDVRAPSKADMENQVETGIEFGIVSTDGDIVTDMVTFGNPKSRPPLLEREFIFNVQDCYTLIADWMYANKGIELPLVPRHWDDVPSGEDLYMELHRSLGGIEVPLSDIQPGDWLHFSLRAPPGFCNHAGVYLGDDQFMHHAYGSLSCIAELYRWRKHLIRVVRYEGTTQ